MKPFNLQEALEGKPVVTRSGLKVTEIHHFKTAKEDGNILFAVIEGRIFSFDLNGSYFSNSRKSNSDLFMEEPIIERWVNIYCKDEDDTLWIGGIFTNYDKAIHSSRSNENYVKTIKIDNKPTDNENH